MTETLTALDGTFLELEEADAGAHMHIGGLLVFAPTPAGGPPSLDVVRGQLERRLAALPRYRQRLSDPHTGGLGWPDWVPDDAFAIDRHVRRAALPAPGGWEELLEWAAAFYAERLDRAHPLWQVVVVEGLAGGHWALATKTHHCMVDGVGSVEAAHLLLDVSPDPPERDVAPPAPPREEHHLLPGWVRASAGLVRHPRRGPELLRRGAAVVELLVREELNAAPRTSLNAPIGSERALRAVRVPLAEAALVKAALGGTVNDVVLAAVTGGLRAVLLARGEDPPEALRAMVPMNVRRADQHGALGNRISSLFVELPVGEPNPIARYERIAAGTAAVKASTQPDGADALLELTQLAPPLVHAIAARSLFATRLFNVTVTNVPGPQQTLYAFGAPMRTVFPLVPLAADHPVGIAVMSYDEQLCFGLNADRDAMPDLDVLAEGLTESLRELQRAAHAL
jgi:diacylglycerol O-acyltransferase / wax synthase